MSGPAQRRPEPRRRAALPDDWPFALRAGIEAVLLAWFLVVGATTAVMMTSAPLSASTALNLGSTIRTGAGLWALGLGGRLGDAGGPSGTLGLPLLGVTILQALLLRSSARRAGLSGPAAGGVAAASAALTGAVLLLLSAPSGGAWSALPGLIVLSTAVIGARLHSQGRGIPALERWWRERPDWVSPALGMARDCALGLLGLSLVALLAAVVAGAGRISLLHDSIAGGGIISSAGLVLFQAAWVPTGLIWAMSWVLGPGFSVGSGTLFAPSAIIAGAVPSLPILGALPAGTWGPARLLPFLIVLGAIAIGWRHRGELTSLSLGRALAAAAGGALLLTAGVAVLCLGATGPIGPARLAHVGPTTSSIIILCLIEVGLGLLTAALMIHPWTRRMTRRGVSAASQAAGSTAQGLRERRGAHGASSAEEAGDAVPAGPRDEEPERAEPAALVVLVSGTGSNLAALIEACEDPAYGAEVVGVVADKECAGLERARAAGIPTEVVALADYPDRVAWDEALARSVGGYAPDLVVCAGFMRLLGGAFLARFGGRVLNTHPSLLPDFPGAHAVRDALAAGATRAGATLFWVDAGVDTGEIIAQVEVPVLADDDEAALTERIKAAETPQLIEQIRLLVGPGR
ncbi:phosphoribosylglycinamide formyltransferase [Actinomyces sp. zg296]|uniref:phosphoribosylglycinamide formyltransferase n=1 Tax=Actinomyces sp. zg296 TaxID=2609289 RepID=UPI001F24B71B|nr:phosphoribosylglycinamide formyltransferase [Actinomyces sp. zg296]